jgi:hypothetical protein
MRFTCHICRSYIWLLTLTHTQHSCKPQGWRPGSSQQTFPSVKHPEIFNLNGGRSACDEMKCSPRWTNLSMCGGAFQIHRKKSRGIMLCVLQLIKQILCGWGRCFQIQRKKNREVLYDYMMQHPTYASIIPCASSSIPNPSMSQLAMNESQIWVTKAETSLVNPPPSPLCNQLCKWVCIISK